MKKWVLSVASVCLIVFPSVVFSEGIIKENLPKLRGVIQMFAERLMEGAVSCGHCHEGMEKTERSVVIEGFKDIEGNLTRECKELTDVFIRELADAGGPLLRVTQGVSGDVVISGTLTPFKGKKKWQLKIKAVSSNTSRVITIYEGLLRTK
ncbi:MAG: hypothetical protein HY805_09400 [Nitrospirae bacterium]|nr:hypothetical protein [Nitrospirota bacterium]